MMMMVIRRRRRKRRGRKKKLIKKRIVTGANSVPTRIPNLECSKEENFIVHL